MNKLNVFIVEDDPMVLFGFKTMVTSGGHIVAGTATDGVTALEKIVKLRPDILLVDINLPEMDGITLLRKVKEHFDIPSIIITGYKSESLLEYALELGVFSYLQKPVDDIEVRMVLSLAMTRYNELQAAQNERDKAITALEERKIIERAKSSLMLQFNMSDEEAMRFMQKKASSQSRKMVLLAQDILKI
ncbi:response regulator [Butyricicoccus faecihominis]|uniref:ANTAR domain-containing response regulator n=1 Tax=Butyricicoccus faecihominis TaxID=1712515 RepID=UPI0024798DE1|nr:response regulator [Butyricicoccus faecihominis]MCQ5130117.1 response regulator [Butyricicoccus faecihominis]